MFRYVLLAVFLPALALAQFPFDLCEEGYPGPISVSVPECPSRPCGLYVGDSITINLEIETTDTVDSLPVTATITDLSTGISFPFPLPSGDACNGIAGGCPLDAGRHTVSFPTEIGGVQSSVEYRIRVQIDDQSGSVVACGSVDAIFN